jgi:hypothetical protein
MCLDGSGCVWICLDALGRFGKFAERGLQHDKIEQDEKKQPQ